MKNILKIKELNNKLRLDKILKKKLPNYSRSYIKKLILNGFIKINNKIIIYPNKTFLNTKNIKINSLNKKTNTYLGQSYNLNIIYEDKYILIINKSYDLIVHPGSGNLNKTLLNALINYYPLINKIPRAGIVHRLDKNTTGLMIIAKTIESQNNLIKLIKMHKIKREYEAIVNGRINNFGCIKNLVGRHKKKYTYMNINSFGKVAVTYYKNLTYFRSHTFIRLRLETGRTHQIRLHMNSINCSLVGDLMYNCYKPIKKISMNLFNILNNFNRQALHSKLLIFYHPIKGNKMTFLAPLPNDMQILLNALKIDNEII